MAQSPKKYGNFDNVGRAKPSNTTKQPRHTKYNYMICCSADIAKRTQQRVPHLSTQTFLRTSNSAISSLISADFKFNKLPINALGASFGPRNQTRSRDLLQFTPQRRISSSLNRTSQCSSSSAAFPLSSCDCKSHCQAAPE